MVFGEVMNEINQICKDCGMHCEPHFSGNEVVLIFTKTLEPINPYAYYGMHEPGAYVARIEVCASHDIFESPSCYVKCILSAQKRLDEMLHSTLIKTQYQRPYIHNIRLDFMRAVKTGSRDAAQYTLEQLLASCSVDHAADISKLICNP